MASEADFSQFEQAFHQTNTASTLPDGYREDALAALHDLQQHPIRARSFLGEASLRLIENTYFNPYLCRQLSVTSNRALTLNNVTEGFLINGEDLDGPLHAMGIFTGLSFVQIPQYDFEPILGVEIGEYQIISGDRPDHLSRRLLVPLTDIGPHHFG